MSAPRGQAARSRSSTPSWPSRCEHQAIDAVIDVGANAGQYASRLRAAGWSGPILSIEPIPETCAQPWRSGRPPIPTGRWRRRWRIGAATGEVVLEVSAESDMSSTLAQSPLLRDISPSSAVMRRIVVPQRRLDELDLRRRAALAAAVREDRRPGRRARGAGRHDGALAARRRGCSSSWRCCRSTTASGPGSSSIGDLAARGFAPYLLFPGLLLARAWAARSSSTWCSTGR